MDHPPAILPLAVARRVDVGWAVARVAAILLAPLIVPGCASDSAWKPNLWPFNAAPPVAAATGATNPAAPAPEPTAAVVPPPASPAQPPAAQVAYWQPEPQGRPALPPPAIPALEALPPIGPAAAPPPPAALAPGQWEIPVQGGSPLPQAAPAPGALVTVSVRDAQLHSVLALIAQQQGLSIVSPSELQVPVTVTLQPTTLENALDALMAVSGCTWTRLNNVIYVTPVKKDASENFLVQGRSMRVFNLSYISATDAEKVITGLLSPVGKVFSRNVDSKDKRKALEQLVVEDLPSYADRIAAYITQADQPPRQVMVEARLLQVKLEKDCRHGVNFDSLARVAGADVIFKTQAFTTGLGPAAIFTVDGTDFNSLLDCLATTNDAKTLAAPKLLMINGQESKIQIGRRLGYFVTTTTQTSTLQDVQFLEVGVVLTVTPQITADGQILMKVRPKVSSGDINPTTTLPEEETTEVDTSIMVPDGHGVIIGGLIQEIDIDRQTKVPYLGDVWLLGRLFQRRSVERERAEVVVALLPRIVPYGNCPTPAESYDLQRIGAPLVTPTLQSAPRPESRLHDAVTNPVWPARMAP